MKNWMHTFVIITALASGIPALARAGASVEGKVNFQGKPLRGAIVYLYDDADQGFSGEARYRSSPTPVDGSFRVDTEPGVYFLVVKKRTDPGATVLSPGDYFAFYGGNPVVLGDGQTIHIGINVSRVLDNAKTVAGGTGIQGTVSLNGEPLPHARVVLYQDGGTIFRGIGYASVMTDAAGRLSVNLEPGQYFVVARKRIGKDRLGPLNPGDLFAFAHENPVQVDQDRFTVVSLNAVEKLNKVKEGGQEVTLGGTVKSGETVIEGTVRDPRGNPVAGVTVGVYRDSMMIYKPDFISSVTGPDGKYRVDLSSGGEYFILARNTTGGPAERGDLLGRYAGNEDHSVTLETGQHVKSIDIAVEVVE